MKIRAITCGIQLSCEDIAEAIENTKGNNTNIVLKMKYAKEQLLAATNKLISAGYEV